METPLQVSRKIAGSRELAEKDGVVALVILVAAVACLRFALRGSRLDPNVVLRVG